MAVTMFKMADCRGPLSDHVCICTCPFPHTPFPELDWLTLPSLYVKSLLIKTALFDHFLPHKVITVQFTVYVTTTTVYSIYTRFR